MQSPNTDCRDPGVTRSTLLDGIRLREAAAWNRLVELYGPLVYSWCRRTNCQPNDAADLTQEVFAAVAANVDRLRRDRPGDSFRAWLRTITKNKVTDHFRRRQKNPVAAGGTDANEQMQQVPYADFVESLSTDSAPARIEVLSRALQLVQGDFEETTWKAFWATTVEGDSAAEVADRLGMLTNAVRQAKFRVIRRIREEFGDLIT